MKVQSRATKFNQSHLKQTMRSGVKIKTIIASGLFLSLSLATVGGLGGAMKGLPIASVSVAAATPNAESEVKKTNEASDVKEADQKPSVSFETYTVKGAKSLAELESNYGKDGVETILKINRVDRRHVAAGSTLIIPTEKVDLMAVAPFPAELDAVSSVDKFILVSRRVQAFGAYESGKLVYWGPTSTGKKATPTPAGLYFTNWKSKETRSSVNRSWRLPWYFNLSNTGGYAFHQYDLPGVPASHGCVRLLVEDAQWIYNWADQWILNSDRSSIAAYGTPVVIFGDYAYGAKAPWKNLIESARATDVSVEEIEAALQRNLPIIQAKVEARRSLIVQSQTAVSIN